MEQNIQYFFWSENVFRPKLESNHQNGVYIFLGGCQKSIFPAQKSDKSLLFESAAGLRGVRFF
jgi:hypothetical protein